jgi:RNA polymerase sigma factor (sigma-70 family)
MLAGIGSPPDAAAARRPGRRSLLAPSISNVWRNFMKPFRRLAGITDAEDPPADLTDETLLAGLGSGDPDLSLAFVRRFKRVVFGVAVSIVRDPATAEDVARETFERAGRHAPMYDARCGSVRGWLLTIARNLAVGALRPRATIPAAPPDNLPALLIAVTGPDKDSARAHGNAAARLHGALAALPPEQTRAVLMAGVYGMRSKQVAEAEGVALGTARNRVRAGLCKLFTAQLRPGIYEE